MLLHWLIIGVVVFHTACTIRPCNSTKHFATLLVAACCARLAILLRLVATCCNMLGVVGPNLKMVKFFIQHLWMLHDIILVWPGCAWTCALVRLQHGGQTRARCCAQQFCGLLRSNFAIVWPELANAGPKMLGCVALRCCYRLAGLEITGVFVHVA